jgi:CRISPR-associated endonuclease/helicase Cas3
MPSRLRFVSAPYFAYWGKARPIDDGPALHQLPYHCLDVAAVGRQYLRHHPAMLRWLTAQIGSDDEAAVREWVTFWLTLHDLGKFSLSFQAQRADLLEQLQGEPPASAGLPGVRHDSLGFRVWREHVAPLAEAEGWFGEDPGVFDGIDCWARAVTGHHGQPPLAQVKRLDLHFRPMDVEAACSFVRDARELFLPTAAAAVATSGDVFAFERRSRELSWWIAGLAVLADWIGSNAGIFHYQAEAEWSLAEYWPRAVDMAEYALAHSGVLPSAPHSLMPFQALFPAIEQPSPLQEWAATAALAAGPQIHLLEDVTGAGKTEAAVMLTHRLIADGVADGFFIGLPTMATANAMYGRIAEVYDRLFSGPTSLVLAHRQKKLVEAFAATVIDAGRDEGDHLQKDDESATRRCQRWLADHNKRALLAPAGVGTIDQALLGVLQSKHQSLRLLGLVRKVLVVDEVHACDAYMQRTLETLLEFHARGGGSAVLLSATLTRRMKCALLAAFARGCGVVRLPPAKADDYPMTTSWSAGVVGPLETEIAARAAVRRTVKISYIADRATIVAGIVEALAAGRCVAWIRNTIGDAMAAQAELAPHVPSDRIELFHARFVLGDRLDIEDRVLEHFGPNSGPRERAGQLLIATQVAEQSLDVDFDLVVSDLAPIDRLIQRAGRLHRHVRDASGRPQRQGSDKRGRATMWIYGPPWTEDAPAGWLKQVLRGSAHVYPNHGELWRTARALQGGSLTMPDDARALIEHVFDANGELPPGLQRSATAAEGQAYADASQARLNGVQLRSGYERSATDWLADTAAPSRLGEETAEVLIGRWRGNAVEPWRNDKPSNHAWAYSSLRVPVRLIATAAPQPTAERQASLDATRDALPGGGRWVTLVAMEPNGGGYEALCSRLDARGVERTRRWRYDASLGLLPFDAPGTTPPSSAHPLDG